MTRIISGQWGGRRIEAPKGSNTRPTTDRVREAVFSSLQSHFGSLNGLRILDVFAGTGALAFEALSRGAGYADLVEKDAKASTTLTANIKALGAGAVAKVHRMPAGKFVRSAGAEASQWDIIFLDPPYDYPSEELEELVSTVASMLAKGGVLVVERSARTPFSWPKDVSPLREKRYGETQIWYGQ